MLIAYGNFLFRYRNILFPAVLFVLFIFFKPYPFAEDENLDIWLDITGILIILIGQGIRAAVIGLAYIKRGGKQKRIHADTLVTEGIFAHCRNPLYVGNLFIIIGFLVIYNNFWVYLLGGGFFLFSYIAIVAAEELFLHRKFGAEFEQYRKRVNRWFINLRGIRKTLSTMTFNWQRVLFKDYTTFLTWFLTVFLILSFEQITFHEFFSGSGFSGSRFLHRFFLCRHSSLFHSRFLFGRNFSAGFDLFYAGFFLGRHRFFSAH